MRQVRIDLATLGLRDRLRKSTLRLPPYQQSALTGSIDLWSREKTQQMLIEVEIVPLFAGANPACLGRLHVSCS